MATCSVPEKKVNIEELLNIYIQNAEELITKCQQLELKDGKKLEKKCISELKYLQSLRKRKKTRADVDIKVQEHDLKSSNLSHFAAIIHAANNLPKVRKILRPFSCKDRADSMVVDVVAQDGRVWVKVIARKAQALHLIWADKELFVCRTALDDFHTILDTLGGESEKQRAKELLEKCTVVSDQPSLRSQKLPQTGKIRDRSKIIFGTGDQLKCVTVSANSGFVRAAEHQGIVFAVYLHQSRALTEKKETLAERIEDLSENTCTSK